MHFRFSSKFDILCRVSFEAKPSTESRLISEKLQGNRFFIDKKFLGLLNGFSKVFCSCKL